MPISPAIVGQTITVMDRSNNVLKQSKTVFSVFKDAKVAYKEKKAELLDQRRAKADGAKTSSDARLKILQPPEIRQKHPSRTSSASTRVHTIHDDDNTSTIHPSKARSAKISDTTKRDDNFFLSDPRASSQGREMVRSTAHLPMHHGNPSKISVAPPPSYHSIDPARSAHPKPTRSSTYPKDAKTLPSDTASTMNRNGPERATGPFVLPRRPKTPVDMDLAYGPYHAPSLAASARAPSATSTDEELMAQCSALQVLLQESQCVGHSVSKTIATLQKDPDTLAAVGLSLAEISTLVGKLAPGAVLSLKGVFPAVFALLAAPEFLIAVGVAAGVTVVIFGGYKIVKRIREKREESSGKKGRRMRAELTGDRGVQFESDEEDEETEEDGEMGSIENWRRGISTVGEDESVDGEYISPEAARSILTAASEASRRSRKSRKEVKASKSAKDEEKASSRERKKMAKEAEREKELARKIEKHKEDRKKERKRRDADSMVAEKTISTVSRKEKVLSSARSGVSSAKLMLVRT